MTMQESQIGRRDVLLFLHFVQLHYFHTHMFRVCLHPCEQSSAGECRLPASNAVEGLQALRSWLWCRVQATGRTGHVRRTSHTPPNGGASLMSTTTALAQTPGAQRHPELVSAADVPGWRPQAWPIVVHGTCQWA